MVGTARAPAARDDEVARVADPPPDLDLFVNAKYKSSLPGCGRRNVYYCPFPHHLGVVGAGRVRRLYLWVTSVVEGVSVVRDRRGFVATYDEIWANSRFTSGHVQRRWGRSATVVHPPCERIAGTDKQRVIAVVGRFQDPDRTSPTRLRTCSCAPSPR